MFDVSEAPERQTADLDETTKKVISDELRRAQEDPSVQQGKIDSQLKAGQDTFNSGFTSGGMNDAIKQKYSGLLGNKLNDMSQSARLNSRFKQVDQMKRAQSALLAQTQVQNDIFAKNLEAQQMKEAARAEAISSILGFAGTMGGFALAKQKSQRDQQPQGTQVKHSSATSGINYQKGGKNFEYNDGGSQGSNQSMAYLDSIQGITEV